MALSAPPERGVVLQILPLFGSGVDLCLFPVCGRAGGVMKMAFDERSGVKS